MTNELRKEVCLSFATKRNTTEGSGLQSEKNSVNCPCKDGDSMPRKERDYKAEYERNKERAKERKKTYTVALTSDDDILLQSALVQFNCKTVGELVRRIARHELVVTENQLD